jgi:hypothetical protein
MAIQRGWTRNPTLAFRGALSTLLLALALPAHAGTPGATLFANGFEAATSACGAPPHFASGLAPTLRIHVATNGSDSSGNGSPANPYATPARALQAVVPGAAVVIHAGTYAGGLFAANLRGTSTAPIWIGGAPGEARPRLQGGSNGLQLSRPRYLVLHDLTVSGASANGINIDDGGDYADVEAARYVVVERVDIRDIGSTGNQDCLKISGLNEFHVLDSDFARCGDSGSGIDFVGAHQGLVYGNRLSEMGSSGVQAKGGSADIEIRGNRFNDGGLRGVNMGGSTGFEFFRPPLSTSAPNAEARDIRVIANLFVGGQTPFAFVGCAGCTAAHNTVVDPGRWLLRILQETTTQGGFVFEPSGNGLLQNNLFQFRRAVVTPAEVNVGANTDSASFVWRNNLFFAIDAPAQSQPGLPGTVSASVVGMDPQISAPDYRTGSSSPAAQSGLAYAQPLGDLGGSCFRPVPSIGAWQAP